MLGMLQVQREAIQAVEQDGIVFIDEIDKIVVNQDLRYGALPDAIMALWFVSHSQHFVQCKQSTSSCTPYRHGALREGQRHNLECIHPFPVAPCILK